MRAWLGLGLWMGCATNDGEEPAPGVEPPDPGPEVYEVEATGAAPWDPIRVQADGELVVVSVDGDGNEVTLERWSDAGGDPRDAWRPPEPGLAPGPHRLSISGLTSDAWAWQVGPYGWEEGFDREQLRGATFEAGVADATFLAPQQMDLLLAQFPDVRVWLEILDVTPDAATFRVIGQRSPDDAPCEVLRAAGELSSTGRLSWSEPSVAVDAEGESLTLLRPSLRAGFLPDGSAGAGGEVTGLVDAEALSRLLLPREPETGLCDLVATLGVPCPPCDAPSGVCLEGYAAAIVLTPAEPLADPLPICGVDLGGGAELPSLSCEVGPIDCGCRSGLRGGLPAGWAALLLLLRRRRA